MEKHQVLIRKYDKESKANKRLSMDNETLAWRLSQGETGESPDVVRRQFSHSPTEPGNSPDPKRKSRGAGQDSFFLSHSPPTQKSNLRRSGTYDLLDQEDSDKKHSES